MKKKITKNYKFIFFILMGLIIFFSPIKNYINVNKITKFINDIKNNPNAPFFYLGTYIAGVIFMIPGFALTIIAAPIFGFWKGLLLVILGANIGCSITFLISRKLGMDFANKFTNSNSFLEKVSNKIEQNGFLIMFYIRLLPIFPFNIVNYLTGLTKIKYKDYFFATLMGMLPGSVVFVYLSYTASDIKNNRLGLVISIGTLIIFTILVYIFKKKQKKL